MRRSHKASASRRSLAKRRADDYRRNKAAFEYHVLLECLVGITGRLDQLLDDMSDEDEPTMGLVTLDEWDGPPQ